MTFRLCVVGIIRFQDKFLLCKMPAHRGAFPGQWAIPGGGVDDGEEMEQALKREIREEVGLEIDSISPFYFRDDTRTKLFPDGTSQEIYMVYLLYWCKTNTDKVTLSEEFEEYAWVTLDEALTYDLNEATRITFEKIRTHRGDETTISQETNSDQTWQQYSTGKIPKGTLCQHCARYNSRNTCSHALVVKDNKLLLIKRARNPMAGYWALPAGYLDWNETAEDCAIRELQEEAGVIGKNPQLLGVYSDPHRDEDGRQNVGIVYVLEYSGQAKVGTPKEILEIAWFDFDALPEKIGFDHRNIVEDYKKKYT